MKFSTTAALLAGAFAFLTVPAAGQSLTEAAAKEKERRAKTKPGKVYTVQELAAGSGSEGGAAPSTDASPKPGAAAKAAPTEEEEQAKKQDAWRKRREKVAADAALWQTEVDRIQYNLNDNTTSPYGVGRQQAGADLADAKAKVAGFQQQLADLDDEGRRNHYR